MWNVTRYPWRIMAKDESTQRSRPAEGKPVEIPVPKRSAWDRLLKKVANPKPDNGKRRGSKPSR